MQPLDLQEMKGIHSVTALMAACQAHVALERTSHPKLPKAAPFSGSGWVFAFLLTPPDLPHRSPTSSSWCRVGGLSWRCLYQVLSQGCAEQETGSQRDGRQLAWAQAGALVALGQVGSTRESCGRLFPMDLGDISYLASEVNNAYQAHVA